MNMFRLSKNFCAGVLIQTPSKTVDAKVAWVLKRRLRYGLVFKLIYFKAKTRLKVLYQSVRVFLYLPYRRKGNKEIVGSVDDVGHNDGNSKQ